MEDMKKEKELKVKSLRVDEETFEKFKKIAGDEFGNQGQCLDALISLYEIENSKVAMVERKLEIESFQDYLNKINNLFLTSLQLNKDAEARIRDEFSRQLNSKDSMIQSLQEKESVYNEESSKNKLKLKELEARVRELIELNDTLTKDKANLEVLIHKNDEILSKNKEEIATMAEIVNDYKKYKEIYDEQVEEMNALKQLNEGALRDIKSRDLEITSITNNSKSFETRIEELKTELKEEKNNIKDIRNEHKEEIKSLEEKLEIKLTKEVESIVKINNERLEIEKKTLENEKKELNLANKEQVNILENKINELENEKREIELLNREKINTLEAKISELQSENEEIKSLQK